MGVRKNAKFLTGAEREAFVRACVLMQADIVNPGAPAAQRYNRWDEYVAIHWMIQNANAPGASNVNFGHGGSGAFSFFSWHRHFLFQFEQQLQSYIPGVMLPYWDWTDPAPMMTPTFLGPNGSVGSGYFAFDAPGTGANPTPAPPWWPAGLPGWRLHSAFGFSSTLRRGLGSLSGLPSATDLREALAMPTYAQFQDAVESGGGLTSANQMHNGMHGWIGGPFGHMRSTRVSPFDPFFYLHHCNIDRLWAMWQLDGHANEYPTSGGFSQHHRNDIMYPWTGGAAGYSTNVSAGPIMMPDFSAVGAKRNVDTLDFRTAYGYTYDTLPVIGIGLDRTGSMSGLTPDPMTTGAPDVTKWEAAKRGVSAFLQDCETVRESGSTYVTAGVKTFRQLATNDFAPLFPGPGYGLVKTGGAVSRAAFDSAVAGMSPGGMTPLADALQDVEDTLVEPPFGGLPAGERRYLAMLTDGVLTSGAPLNSIPDHSYTDTAVFAMGFGTGTDVDYATLAALVAKGQTLTTPQVFHGENAGTIDKFYSNALARVIGFTAVIDPLLELFEGEHAHVDFLATLAEDAFLITAQGMDFVDENWSFVLHGPDGAIVYGDAAGHTASSHAHGTARPDITARRANGRLTLMLQRDNADAAAWVGPWQLMVAYKARRLDAMVMPSLGELILPVSAGRIHGPRYARLLSASAARIAARNVKARPAHRLDTTPPGNNRNDRTACNAVVNIYAQTRLQMDLMPHNEELAAGRPLTINVRTEVLQGAASTTTAIGRLVAPNQDLTALVPRQTEQPNERTVDPARRLAEIERRERKLRKPRDQELKVVTHDDHAPHVHITKTPVPGVYHIGLAIEGHYHPNHDAAPSHHDETTHADHHADSAGQPFLRILTTTVALT
jgi:hypothetical protein